MMSSMRNFIFRCPALGVNVQASAAVRDGGEGRRYVGQRCAACGNLHLVNPDNGKLLAEDLASDTQGRPN